MSTGKCAIVFCIEPKIELTSKKNWCKSVWENTTRDKFSVHRRVVVQQTTENRE